MITRASYGELVENERKLMNCYVSRTTLFRSWSPQDVTGWLRFVSSNSQDIPYWQESAKLLAMFSGRAPPSSGRHFAVRGLESRGEGRITMRARATAPRFGRAAAEGTGGPSGSLQ